MISIIIPTLNEISVIEETLKRFRAAKRHRFEIIVSDGRSTDGTVEIARKYADKVIVYTGSKRQTIAMARNAGVREAHGEFLAFFDADVILLDPDNFFDEVLALFGRSTETVALTTGIRVLPEFETWSDRFFFTLINWAYFFENNILGIGAASGECQIVRHRAFDQLGGYREYLAAAEDQEFFRRLAKIGKTYYCRNLSVYHTGRRAHKIGWPKLLSLWIVNGIFVPIFGRSFNKEWREIR